MIPSNDLIETKNLQKNTFFARSYPEREGNIVLLFLL